MRGSIDLGELFRCRLMGQLYRLKPSKRFAPKPVVLRKQMGKLIGLTRLPFPIVFRIALALDVLSLVNR